VPPAPEIAVVIPTRGRETRLAFALDALAEQTLARDRFEVFVVRDADAREPLAKLPEGLNGAELRLPGVGGPTPKRNLGWRSSSAPVVAFTDDDCRPAPDWLERLLDAVEPGDVVLQGRTEADPDERHLLHGLARTTEVSDPGAWFETCNIAYPRDLLERLDGFDEGFDFIGDDTDLGLRAREGGARVIDAHEALVWHAVFPRSPGAALRDAVHRRAVPALVARHPGQRRELYLGVFTHPNHARLLLALAGLALWRRAPLLGALAAIPYLSKNVDRRRLTPWGILRLPMQLSSKVAVDAAEIAASAASSIRNRSLVL
jgi:GT2 family glycosyltransferase